MVLCDARLKVNRWTKIYPNFTGIPDANPQSNFGWRQASYIPPVVSFMAPDRFEESLSFLKMHQRGVNLFRQGIWPPKRPEPGPMTWAEAEYIHTNPRPGFRGEVQFTVWLHPGHQAVAEDMDALPDRVPVVWTLAPQWREEAAAPALREHWWNGYWHYRLPFSVNASVSVQDILISQTINLRDYLKEGDLDPNSLRMFEVDAEGNPIAPCAFEYAEDSRLLTWQIKGSQTAGASRLFHLYFDTLANGPKAPSFWADRVIGESPIDTSLEKGERHWTFEGSEPTRQETHSGQKAALLHVGSYGGVSLLSSGSMRPFPNRRYLLRFWAKVLEGEGLLRANFYAGPKYDFPQMPIPLIKDGNWHRYEVVLTTGDFPAEAQPHLRLWVMDKQQKVLLDDIECVPLGQEPYLVEVRVGRPE